MAWINKGDAASKEMPKVEFQPREVKSVNMTAALPPQMAEDLTIYCENRRMSKASLIWFLVGREIWKWER